MKWMAAATLAAVAAASPAGATFLCTLSGTPVLAASGGLAEPAGDVALQCAGAPNQTVRLTFSVLLDQRVANPIDFEGGNAGGVMLWLDSGATPTPLPNLPRLLGNLVIFENVVVASNPFGQLSMRVTGLRVEVAETVSASIQLVADTPMLLPVNRVVVARAAPGLYATVMPAALCCAGPPLPASLDWAGVLARHPWPAVARVTEGYSAAFQPVSIPGPPDQATRLVLRLKGLPPGSRVFVPVAVAGDNAFQPTQSGAFGTDPQPGFYSPSPGPSLLLSLAPQAAADGSGGLPVQWPGTPLPLEGVYEAAVEGEEAWAVYQVMEADPGKVETAEIPLWVFTPMSRSNQTEIARLEARLAPLSDKPGAAADAPLPRYRELAPEPDCVVKGDCAADYFPALSVKPSQTTEFALQSEGGLKDAYLFVTNEGGWFAEWEADLRDPDAAQWLLLRGTGGYAVGSYHYQLNPKDLPPGDYSAEIVFRQKNSPSGVNAEIVIPVKLTVTEGPPPQPPQPPTPPEPPAPAVWAAMTVPFGFEGPFANGGLMKLQGIFFAEETTVTVGGLPAQVLSVQPGELLIRIPDAVERGWQPVAAANGGQSSQPIYADVLPVAPSIVAVANGDGRANAETEPVAPGAEAELAVTGIALADEPVWVNVHDRWQPAIRQAGAGPGLNALRITIPDDLPAMMTAVKVCVSGPGVDSICSHPAPIWLGAQQ